MFVFMFVMVVSGCDDGACREDNGKQDGEQEGSDGG